MNNIFFCYWNTMYGTYFHIFQIKKLNLRDKIESEWEERVKYHHDNNKKNKMRCRYETKVVAIVNTITVTTV